MFKRCVYIYIYMYLYIYISGTSIRVRTSGPIQMSLMLASFEIGSKAFSNKCCRASYGDDAWRIPGSTWHRPGLSSKDPALDEPPELGLLSYEDPELRKDAS